MLDQVRQKAARFDEIERLCMDPAIISNGPQYSALMKERSQLIKIANPFKELEALQKQKQDTQALLTDPDFKAEAETEIAALDARERELFSKLEELVLLTDAKASSSAILEIRPGVGGEESCLFAKELLEMYLKFAQRKRWDVQLMDVAYTDLGGLKNATVSIEGEEVYRFLKHETGAHRVQRVPRTEASGRIHTSIATVAVLPQAEEVDVQINAGDVRIDTYSAGGPGGQHVNKTQSAVRLTHAPTGIVVQCQDQRSQNRNRDLAWKWLRARLYDHYEELRARERRDLRRTQVGTGDRSEKIRTYNFHDNRITDHRIGFSVHQLESFLHEGEIDEMIGKLLEEERSKKLEALSKKQ